MYCFPFIYHQPHLFFYFTMLYWVCHTSTWIHHGCTHVPNPELPSPLLPPYHPSGSSQCTSPKHPVSCIKPRLRFISYMILHMFQCHSPKSSHHLSLPLPQSPKRHRCIEQSFECWVLSQHFISPLSLSSRCSLVLLCILQYKIKIKFKKIF